jgi:hypothetical protein
MIARIPDPGHRHLSLIGQTSDDLRILTGPGKPRQQRDSQNGNTGENHHQLNQGEAGFLRFHIINRFDSAQSVSENSFPLVAANVSWLKPHPETLRWTWSQSRLTPVAIIFQTRAQKTVVKSDWFHGVCPSLF